MATTTLTFLCASLSACGPEGAGRQAEPPADRRSLGDALVRTGCVQEWCGYSALNMLTAVWTSAPDDVWVSEWRLEKSIMHHFDGEHWMAWDLPGDAVVVNDIWGDGHGLVWAVGYEFDAEAEDVEVAVAFTWTPEGWVNVLRGETLGFLQDVGGSSPDDMWISGFEVPLDRLPRARAEPGWLSHAVFSIRLQDGETWRELQTPLPAECSGGSSGRDIWIAHDERAARWDGESWTEFRLPATWLTSGPCVLWSMGEDHAWIGNGIQLRWWNGERWREDSFIFSDQSAKVTAIDGSDPENVWIVGGQWARSPRTAETVHLGGLVEDDTFDPNDWLDALDANLKGVSVSSPENVWIIGHNAVFQKAAE